MTATPDQILKTFGRHVARFGYSKASVEGVAAELGISKKTIYQHFPTKRDLMAAVVAEEAGRERTRLLAELQSEPTARAQAERFFRLILGGLRQMIARTSKADWEQQYEIAYEAMGAAYGSVAAEIVQRGVASGEFDLADLRTADIVFAGVFNQYAQSLREDPSLRIDDELVAALMRVLGQKKSTKRASARAR